MCTKHANGRATSSAFATITYTQSYATDWFLRFLPGITVCALYLFRFAYNDFDSISLPSVFVCFDLLAVWTQLAACFAYRTSCGYLWTLQKISSRPCCSKCCHCCSANEVCPLSSKDISRRFLFLVNSWTKSNVSFYSFLSWAFSEFDFLFWASMVLFIDRLWHNWLKKLFKMLKNY